MGTDNGGGQSGDTQPKLLWLFAIAGAGLNVIGGALLYLLDDARWVAWIMLIAGSAMLVGVVLYLTNNKLQSRLRAEIVFLLVGAIGGGLATYALSPQEEEDWIYNLTPVIGQRFINETVEVDGNKFINCIFENVTLHYVGKGSWHFESVKWKGTIAIRMQSKATEGYLRLTNYVATIPGVEVTASGTVDEAGRIAPFPGAVVVPPDP